MVELLLVVAFTAHLVAVNVAAVGPLYCVAVEWRAARRGDAAAQQVARRFAVWAVFGFAVGMAIGGGLLAILWQSDAAYWSAVERVPAHRWWFFGGEVVFYFVCMVPYVLMWDRAASQRWWHRLLAVLAATNLLYHFPPLFVMLSLMMSRPELAGEALDRSLYVELFTDPETLARVAHHWLSATATTGVALMLLATRPSAASARTTVFAARVALAATVVQLPVGLWLLLVSPAGAQSQLLGGEALGTALFVGAILAAVLLLQQLLTAALGDGSRRTAVKSAVLLLVVLLLMSGVLHRTRDGGLAEVDRNVSRETLLGDGIFVFVSRGRGFHGGFETIMSVVRSPLSVVSYEPSDESLGYFRLSLTGQGRGSQNC